MFKGVLKKWRYRQYLYCISAMLTLTTGHMHMSWTSPFLPALTSDDSPIGITLTTIESSVVVCLLFMGFLLGSLFTIKAVDIIGRKMLFVISGILSLVAWIMIYFAHYVEVLYVARIIAGMGLIIALNCAPIYNGELSDNDNRGKIGFLIIVFNNLGLVIGYVVGPYTSYYAFAIISGSFTAIASGCVLFIPETPYFLIKKHKYEEAKRVIWKLSCNETDENNIKKKLEDITLSVQKDMMSKATLSELVCSGKYKKALAIQIGLILILFFSGAMTINVYLQSILNDTGSNIPSNTSSLIYGIFNLVSALLSGQIVDRYGRKPLLFASCAVTSVSTFVIAIYFYLKQTTFYNLDVISWLPLASIIMFTIFVAIGIGPMPGVVVAEIYPLNVKGIAFSIGGLIMAPAGVLVQFAFEPLNEFWGIYTTLWIFSACCLMGILYSIFVLPETKGKSFEEIQKEIIYEGK